MPDQVLIKDEILSVHKDGNVTLYRRAGSKVNGRIHYRVRVPGIKNKYLRKSSGTSDYHAAVTIARDHYDDLVKRKKDDLTVFSAMMKDLCHVYLKDLKKKMLNPQEKTTRSMYETAEKVILKYFMEYWPDKDVTSFTKKDLLNYHEWRWEEWDKSKKNVFKIPTKKGEKRFNNASVKQPSYQTRAREEGILNQVLRFGYEDGWIKPSELPQFRLTKFDKKRRAGFTEVEFEKLRSHLARRIDNNIVLKSKNIRVSYRITYQRRLLYNYICFLAYTGIRVGECRNLRFGDIYSEKERPEVVDEIIDRMPIEKAMFFKSNPLLSPYEVNESVHQWNEDKNNNICVFVPEGKTGPREVAAQPSILKIRNSLLKHYPVDKVTENSFLWVNHKGEPINSFKETFATVLDHPEVQMRFGMLDRYTEARRSLYSLRHFYATDRLEKKTNIHLLAKNMGTSVHHIEKYYSHVSTVKNASDITDPEGKYKDMENSDIYSDHPDYPSNDLVKFLRDIDCL